MEVILLEKLDNLGGLGEKVSVKSGFGRNFLIPKGKAVFASPENVRLFEARRAELEQGHDRRRDDRDEETDAGDKAEEKRQHTPQSRPQRGWPWRC